jgi:hypothetical protein
MDSLMLPLTYDFTLNKNALKIVRVLQHNFFELKNQFVVEVGIAHIVKNHFVKNTCGVLELLG